MQFGYASRIVAIATLLRWKSRRSTQPASVMALRYWTESPAMLPNAHVACSRTPSLGELHQAMEVRKRAAVDHGRRLSITENNNDCLFLRARSNVGKHPSRFILQVGTVVVLQEESKTRNQSRVNHEVDWRIVIYR